MTKYTICPPGPEPKLYTASCPEMVKRLKNADDLTIDHRSLGLWQSWENKLVSKPIEDRLVEVVEKVRHERSG